MSSRFGYPDGGVDGGLMTNAHPGVAAFFSSLDRMMDGVERMAADCKPPLGGERYMTDREVSERLKVSRRTLQEWRYGGQMPYLQIGGKILFRESDIQRMLDGGLRNLPN
jgi:excisionase family DNA binding protein